MSSQAKNSAVDALGIGDPLDSIVSLYEYDDNEKNFIEDSPSLDSWAIPSLPALDYRADTEYNVSALPPSTH